MDYVDILRRSWHIAWRNKYLWLFGFLASIYLFFPSTNPQMLPPEAQGQIEAFISSPASAPVLAGFIAFMVLLNLGFAVLHALGRPALDHQVNQIASGETGNSRSAWGAARRFGWRAFWIGFLLGLPIILVIWAGLAPYLYFAFRYLLGFSTEASAMSVLVWSVFTCTLPGLCLGLLLGILLGMLNALAERACVLEDLSIRESLHRGWALLRGNFGRVFVLWLILTLIHVGVIFFLYFPMIILMMPLIGIIMAGAISMRDAFPFSILVGWVCLTPFFWGAAMLLASIVEPFFSGSWTLAYRELAGLETAPQEVT